MKVHKFYKENFGQNPKSVGWNSKVFGQNLICFWKDLSLKDVGRSFRDTGTNHKGCFQSIKSFDLNLTC